MGFHALMKREDVPDILQKTLQNYYTERYPGKQIYIGYEKREGAAEFFLTPRVGMILQKHPPRQLCRHYYSAYHIRNDLLKLIAAQTLVFLSLHFPRLTGLKQRLYIWPKELVNDRTLFSYCNRSIRIFDYAAGTTVSIRKQGFTDKFFQNQLRFRLAHPYPFIPPVLASGKTWFEEAIYTGSVLARISDRQQYARAQAQTLAYMTRLQTDTLRQTPTRDYVAALCDRLSALLEQTALQKTAGPVPFAKDYLQRLRTCLAESPQALPTVISHKDLQGGNILQTADGLWIIDWETQGRGSRWFDAITLLYGTRYYGGIRRLTREARLPDAIGDPEGWSVKQILALFLLEDLEFYLEDMLELPGTAGAATFEAYISELREIPWNTVF